MEILTLTATALLAAAAGAAIAWTLAQRKSQSALTDLALAQQKSATLEQDLTTARIQSTQYESTITDLRNQLTTAQTHSATLAAQLAASEKNISEQKALLDDANKKLTDAFATVSQNALARSNEVFIQMAEAKFKTLSAESTGSLDERKAQIATLLKPLETTLAELQKRLTETEDSRKNAYGEILKHIGAMSATEQTLAQQTSQLVSALKKSDVRGRWGEIALRRLAELAGMTNHVDFEEQKSIASEDGRVLRPDMTIHLPGNRSVVVDSKAVINAFLQAASAAEDSARAQCLAAHAKNVRSRVDDLSSKAYWKQFDTAPDCVVLFLPGESFLYAACDADPGLIEYAVTSNVYLATPTTFLLLLKTIEMGWRQQALSENAEQIRDLGKQIYDRAAVFGTHLEALRKSLDNAVDNFNKTVGSLQSNVLVSARKIGELGAATDKAIPEIPAIDRRARDVGAPLFSE